MAFNSKAERQIFIIIFIGEFEMADSVFENVKESEKSLILKVLQKIAPLECDIAGSVTLKYIIDGVQFGGTSRGHQIDLSDTISLLGGIATLAQITIIVGQWGYKKISGQKKDEHKKDTINNVKIEITNNINLVNITIEKANILEDIYDVIDGNFNADEKRKDRH